MVSNVETTRGKEILPDASTEPRRGKPFEPGNQLAVGHKTYSPAEDAADVGECLKQLQDGKTLWQVQEWGQKDKDWSYSHTASVIKQSRKLLLTVSRETAEETRVRILAMIEKLIPDCERFVVGSGSFSEGHGEGSVIMTHPETGEPLKFREHKAIQGYLALAMKLQGLDKTIVEHHNAGNKRPSELSNEELDAELDAVEAELANRAKPAEAQVVE